MPKKAPQKQCPKCQAMVHVRKAKCECGYEWTKTAAAPAPKKKAVKKVVVRDTPVKRPKRPLVESANGTDAEFKQILLERKQVLHEQLMAINLLLGGDV